MCFLGFSDQYSSKRQYGFCLSRNFYVGTRVNKTEAMYGRSRVNLKVERGSTFTFACDLRYIAYTLRFIYASTHVKITRQWKSTLTEKKIASSILRCNCE